MKMKGLCCSSESNTITIKRFLRVIKVLQIISANMHRSPKTKSMVQNSPMFLIVIEIITNMEPLPKSNWIVSRVSFLLREKWSRTRKRGRSQSMPKTIPSGSPIHKILRLHCTLIVIRHRSLRKNRANPNQRERMRRFPPTKVRIGHKKLRSSRLNTNPIMHQHIKMSQPNPKLPTPSSPNLIAGHR